MRIIIMGPPGVGKGTEASMLEAQFNIPHVSTGDIFRALFRTDDPIGIEAREYIDKGLLVPDELTNRIVETRFRTEDVHHGFIFDGYPRNVAQAEAFTKFLNERNWKVDTVINVDTKDETIIERLSGRRVCPKCGATYHIVSNKPRIENICDNDQTELIQRKDDKPETIKNRLEIYHRETKPVIEYYRKAGLLVNVDGSGDIENTHRQVLKIIGDLK
ncbi:adenylate kinase [Haploplasma axanthum]|nr:adenylate kinase [Haploplasma axanthum]